MRLAAFASRNRKEILRDPLNIAFGVGFPLVLLFLLSAIQANVPVSLFEIEQLTPGIAVFGLSFISLFSGMLIAKDRSSSFLTRLFASPLSASDYILGYALPLLPIAIMQSAICFLAAFFLGLAIKVKILVTLMVLIPTAILYMGFGLLAGSLFNDKQVGGICGALLTNLSAWLSGTWFDLNLVGGAFEKVAELLPFVHAVDAAKAAISGEYTSVFPHLLWVIGYGVVIFSLAVVAFRKKMKGK